MQEIQVNPWVWERSGEEGQPPCSCLEGVDRVAWRCSPRGSQSQPGSGELSLSKKKGKALINDTRAAVFRLDAKNLEEMKKILKSW